MSGGSRSASRAAAAAAAGHHPIGEAAARVLARQAAHDAHSSVRAAALAALARSAPPEIALAAWAQAARDRDPSVRLRAAEVAPTLGHGRTRRRVPLAGLLALLDDPNAWVAEAAAFALGERPAATRSVTALARAATEHADPLVREAAVGALGALGDERGLPAVLRACDDKPAVRRRAVLALAAFEGTEVEARLRAALTDHDWQVRQIAEDLQRDAR